jgi:hypothetical protein
MEIKDSYNVLVQSIMLVASTYETQIATLPEFVHSPDEIALIYNDAYLITPQLKEQKLISLNTLPILKELDDLFDAMSEDKSLWTFEKLKDDKSWKRSRELAFLILEELGVSYNIPNLSFINWVK